MNQDQEWVPDSDVASEGAAPTGPGAALSVVIVIGLILLAAALRFIGIGQFSFWIDEIRTVALSGVPCPPFMTSIFIHPDAIPWHTANLLGITQGPLFAGLVHVWHAQFGAGEAALRSLPALLAVLTVPVFAGLGARLVDRGAALLATLVLVISPFHIWYAQELRGYSMVILSAALATLFLLKLVEAERERHHTLLQLCYGASLLLGLGGSLTMGFLLPVHGLVVIARLPAIGWRRFGGFIVTWVVVAVCVSPWLGAWGGGHDITRLAGRQRVADRPAVAPAIAPAAVDSVEIDASDPSAVDSTGIEAATIDAPPTPAAPSAASTVADPPLRGETTMPPAAIPYTFYVFSAGFSLGPTPAELHRAPVAAVRDHLLIVGAVGLVFGVLAIIGLGRLLRTRPGTAVLLLIWIAIPFAITAWMAASNIKVWNARYVAVTYPAFLLFVGAGLGAMRGRWRLGFLAIVLAISATSLWNLRRDPAYGKDDYRSAAAYLDHMWQEGDALIGVDASLPVHYYADFTPSAYVHLLPHRYSDEEIRRRIGPVHEGYKSIWLFRGRAQVSDPDNRVGAILGETHTRAERITFPGIELERYVGVEEDMSEEDVEL